MSQLLRVSDKIITSEASSIGGIRGEVIFGRGKRRIPFIDPFGKQSYRTEFDEVLFADHNIVPIGGYQFAFDKLFNIGLDQDTTLRVGDLNDEAPQMKIGVPRSKYKSIYYDAECSVSDGSMVINSGINISAMNFIFGFMMGDGGAREDNITPIAPNYKNRSLFHPIPFRMSNDGYPIENGKYYGKVQSFQGSAGMDPVTSYFVKLFDDPRPRIVHAWVTDNSNERIIVDDTVFASTSSAVIESYVEINFSVNSRDGRGYCASTNSTPRINEFGLISGWFNAQEDDYESLRLFTHFTRPSITLSSGDAIEAIYRLHAR